MAQDYHFALLDGQVVDQVANVLLDLFVDHLLFDVAVGQLLVVQNVVTGIVAGDVGRLLVAAEVVDDLVVGNTQHPRDEFPVLRVSAGAQAGYDFDEGFLKEVIGCLLVFDQHQNIVIYLLPVTFDKGRDRRFIASNE